MADSPAYPDSNGEIDRGSTTGTPRWVKVFGIVVAVLVLVLVVLLVVRGGPPGDHGPGRHTSSGDIGSGDIGGQTPSSSVTADHVRPPWLGDLASPESGPG
jgi:hypothetical protein